jgi:hypothetical protein
VFRWEDNHEWRVGKDLLVGVGSGLLKGTELVWGAEKNHENIRIAGSPTEIRLERPGSLITSQERDRYINLLCGFLQELLIKVVSGILLNKLHVKSISYMSKYNYDMCVYQCEVLFADVETVSRSKYLRDRWVIWSFLHTFVYKGYNLNYIISFYLFCSW